MVYPPAQIGPILQRSKVKTYADKIRSSLWDINLDGLMETIGQTEIIWQWIKNEAHPHLGTIFGTALNLFQKVVCTCNSLQGIKSWIQRQNTEKWNGPIFKSMEYNENSILLK